MLPLWSVPVIFIFVLFDLWNWFVIFFRLLLQFYVVFFKIIIWPSVQPLEHYLLIVMLVTRFPACYITKCVAVSYAYVFPTKFSWQQWFLHRLHQHWKIKSKALKASTLSSILVEKAQFIDCSYCYHLNIGHFKIMSLSLGQTNLWMSFYLRL